MIRTDIVEYIIKFLVSDEKFSNEHKICYDYPGRVPDSCKIVIVPSGFFEEDIYGTRQSVPQLPLKTLKDMPILFGTTEIRYEDERIVVCADIIASTYFLISRYEEMVSKEERDAHGRFKGKKSILYRSGYMDIPVVDYYGSFLRKLLAEKGIEVDNQREGFNSVTLSHDVDYLWTKFTFYTMLRRTVSSALKRRDNVCFPLSSYLGRPERDPVFKNLEWLLNQDKKTNADVMLFIVAGTKNRMEGTFSYIKTSAFRKFYKGISQSAIKIGHHISYEAADDLALIRAEKELLESVIGYPIVHSRNHYLRDCFPEMFDDLIKCGITDDYTMGYADCPGFRLGTSKRVRWINPVKKELTNLVLHPLQIMDVSLGGECYMNLTYNKALALCLKIIRETKINHGDLIVLWHNHIISMENNDYYRVLYKHIIKEIYESM